MNRLHPKGLHIGLPLVLLFLLFEISHTQIQKTSLGILHGAVVDAQTGQALPQAIVRISNISPPTQRRCDSLGHFSFPNLAQGQYRLLVQRENYHPLRLESIELNRDSLGILIALQPLSEEDRLRLMRDTMRLSLPEKRRRRDLSWVESSSKRALNSWNAGAVHLFLPQAPGIDTRQDPSRQLGALFGNLGQDARNDLSFRAWSPAQVEWRLEGLILPHFNHLGNTGQQGGFLSLLLSKGLGPSDFLWLPGQAHAGSSPAGLVDLNLRSHTETCLSVENKWSSLSGLESYTQIPLTTHRQANFSLGLRYAGREMNFLNRALQRGFGQQAQHLNAYPSLGQVQFKLDFLENDKGSWALFGILGRTEQAMQGRDSLLILQDPNLDLYFDRYHQASFFLLGLRNRRYLRRFSKRTHWEQRMGLARVKQFDNLEHALPSRLPAPVYVLNLKQWDWQWQHELHNRIDSRDAYRLGLVLRFSVFSGLKEARFLPSEALDSLTLNDVHAEQRLYGQWQRNWGKHWLLQGGLQLKHHNRAQNWAFEPRFNLNYQPHPRHLIYTSYAWTEQTAHAYFLLLQGPKRLPYLRTQSLHLGYRFLWARLATLHFDAYRQHSSQILSASNQVNLNLLSYGAAQFAGNWQGEFLATGLAQHTGLQIQAHKHAESGWYAWGSFAYSLVEYWTAEGKKLNLPFAPKWRGQAQLGRRWDTGTNSRLSLALGFQYLASQAYLPLDLQASQQAGRSIYDWQAGFTDQSPNYWRVDAACTWDWKSKRQHLGQSLGLNVLNLLNRKNETYWIYNSLSKTAMRLQNLPFFIDLSYRLQF